MTSKKLTILSIQSTRTEIRNFIGIYPVGNFQSPDRIWTLDWAPPWWKSSFCICILMKRPWIRQSVFFKAFVCCIYKWIPKPDMLLVWHPNLMSKTIQPDHLICYSYCRGSANLYINFSKILMSPFCFSYTYKFMLAYKLMKWN